MYRFCRQTDTRLEVPPDRHSHSKLPCADGDEGRRDRSRMRVLRRFPKCFLVTSIGRAHTEREVRDAACERTAIGWADPRDGLIRRRIRRHGLVAPRMNGLPAIL